MRCAKQVQGKNAFCDECLAEMEQYPVKPGAVYIPVRPVSPQKTRWKAEISPEVQLASARKTITLLQRVIAGLTAALVICAGILFYILTLPGETVEDSSNTRNYSTSVIDSD